MENSFPHSMTATVKRALWYLALLPGVFKTRYLAQQLWTEVLSVAALNIALLHSSFENAYLKVMKFHFYGLVGKTEVIFTSSSQWLKRWRKLK